MLTVNGKVTQVNPGVVSLTGGSYWEYSLEWVLNDRKVVRWSNGYFPTSNAAKQSMRENLVFERRRHMLHL